MKTALFTILAVVMIFSITQAQTAVNGEVVPFQNKSYANSQGDTSAVYSISNTAGAVIYFTANDTVNVKFIVEYRGKNIYASWAKTDTISFSSSASPYFAKGIVLRGLMGKGYSDDLIPSAILIRIRVLFSASGNGVSGNEIYSLILDVR